MGKFLNKQLTYFENSNHDTQKEKFELSKLEVIKKDTFFLIYRF